MSSAGPTACRRTLRGRVLDSAGVREATGPGKRVRQRVRIHRVRLGGSGVRVVRPAPVAARLALRDDHHWLSMYADRDGAAQLAAMWALAARSLVHLPIRANPAPDGVVSDGEPVSLDLVLVHHSLQFRTASWRQVRARLGSGEPHTAATPDHDFPDEAAIDHQRREYRTYRDHLGFDIAAHALFVVGSSTAFREHGTALRSLVDEARPLCTATRTPGTSVSS
jgi:hypothetical protein